MRLLVLVGAVIGLLAIASAYPDGAGTCFEDTTDPEMFNMHHGGPDSSSTEMFKLVASASNYLPGCTYTVSLCCSTHRGFLLYAKSDSMSRVGSFALGAELQSTTKYQTCAGALASTLTHRTNADKAAMHFTWTAPQLNAGEITLYGTIVVGPRSNWFDHHIKLPLDTTPNATCPPVPTSNVCPQADGGHDHGDMDMGGGGHGMSSMTTFHTNWKGVTIVFPTWTINNQSGYVCSLIGVAAIAALFELLQVAQMLVDQRFRQHNAAKVLKRSTPEPSKTKKETSNNNKDKDNNMPPMSPNPQMHTHAAHHLSVEKIHEQQEMQPLSHASIGIGLGLGGTMAETKTQDTSCCVEVDDNGNIIRRETPPMLKGTVRSSFSALPFGDPHVHHLAAAEAFPFSTQQHVVRSGLHMLRTFISFFLMIVFMTMDVGLVFAVVIGAGAGFFLFARNRPVTSQVGCHT